MAPTGSAYQVLNYEVDIGPAESRAMGKGILGPGPVLDAVPIPKVCTSCRTNIHVVIIMRHIISAERLVSSPALHARPRWAWTSGHDANLERYLVPHTILSALVQKALISSIATKAGLSLGARLFATWRKNLGPRQFFFREPTDVTFPSLRELTEVALVESLGKLATDDQSSPFCCGGNLEIPHPIDIIYRQTQSVMGKNDGQRQSSFQGTRIALPGASEIALSELVCASNPTICERSREWRVDEQDCQGAYQLNSDSFFTSFQLCSTTILNEIESLIQPNRSIQAEIDRLNIYTAGGCFKACANTAQCTELKETKFGKLVICLPSQFTGGTLITHHCGNKVEFNWSNSTKLKDPQLKDSIIQWAAFFSGTEHELLPVISGYCITLTYNLYSAEERPTFFPTGNPFCRLLYQVTNHPHFMRNGGSLGFQCQHSYAYTKLNKEDLVPLLLKGSDYMVFSAAKAMGLKVRVRPIVEGYKHWYLMAKFSDAVRHYDPELSGADDEMENPMDVEMKALGARDGPKRSQPVTWCTAVQLDQIAGYYRDWKSLNALYQAAVIVVDIPTWSDRESTNAGVVGRISTRSKGKKRPSETPTEELEQEVHFWLQERRGLSYEDEFSWGYTF